MMIFRRRFDVRIIPIIFGYLENVNPEYINYLKIISKYLYK